ncbi:hypothetical protein QJS10_CPB13g01172 [Acorus calamus]|uniref:Uncharacterized protein n=1 Tax=Acorus calamus TaxID=4465 RepID=A0AAV9DH17_ACOCL|nr:hypothetical protein QJS10_CPB13g01172 [Acorus calamus]
MATIDKAVETFLKDEKVPSFQSVVENIVQEIHNFSHAQPVLVFATKATIFGLGSVRSQHHQFSEHLLMSCPLVAQIWRGMWEAGRALVSQGDCSHKAKATQTFVPASFGWFGSLGTRPYFTAHKTGLLKGYLKVEKYKGVRESFLP